MNPEWIAQCGQLAMLLELSANPKPGNVDRDHDFEDIGFRHFLVSAVLSYPVFRMAASGQEDIGKLLLKAVSSWKNWGLPGNTHFGSLILMIPIAMAAGRLETLYPNALKSELVKVLEDTSVDDAIDFYEAFRLSDARVADVEEYSLHDPTAIDELKKQGRSLLELMRLSEDHDLIAREWSTGYHRSFRLANRLAGLVQKDGLNKAIVITFLEALSAVPDSLVQAKFGSEIATSITFRAARALEDNTLSQAEKLDLELLKEDINPGSTADIIATSLFIALLKGLRF